MLTLTAKKDTWAGGSRALPMHLLLKINERFPCSPSQGLGLSESAFGAATDPRFVATGDARCLAKPETTPEPRGEQVHEQVNRRRGKTAGTSY